jgi:hypothetical protein
MRTIFLTIGCLLGWLHSPAQYKTIGDAAPMGDCIRLTLDEPYSEGIAYNTSRLDLNNLFEIEFDIFWGTKTSWAPMELPSSCTTIHGDSRLLVLWRRNWIRQYGPRRQLDCPFDSRRVDTYQNYTQNDPPYDHVALLVNGVNLHPGDWKESTENLNLEDDKLHNFRFRWNPSDLSIRVHLGWSIGVSGQKGSDQ